MSNTHSNIKYILVEVMLKKVSSLRVCMSTNYEKMDKLSKKRWVDSLRTHVLGLVVGVNSRVVLEGKKKVKKRSLSVRCCRRQRG